MSDYHASDARNCCCHCGRSAGGRSDGGTRRGGFGGLVRTVLSLVMLYAVLLFGSGTLIKTGHPVAVETGRLIRVITFVEPTINWAESRGHPILAGGLERLAAGVRVG